MSLVPSLLQAIVRVDGEALVMHVGEKPYVVSPNGQIDLATRGLTFEAVSGLVAQLLPADAMRSLDEVGATQFELPPFPEFPGEQFTVTAARGGEDVWAEIRRRQAHEDDLVAPDLFAAFNPPVEPVAEAPVEDLALPQETQLWPNEAAAVAPAVISVVPVVDAPPVVAASEAAAFVEVTPPLEVGSPVEPVAQVATPVDDHRVVPEPFIAAPEPVLAVETTTPEAVVVPITDAASAVESQPVAVESTPVTVSAPEASATALQAHEPHESQKALASWLAAFTRQQKLAKGEPVAAEAMADANVAPEPVAVAETLSVVEAPPVEAAPVVEVSPAAETTPVVEMRSVDDMPLVAEVTAIPAVVPIAEAVAVTEVTLPVEVALPVEPAPFAAVEPVIDVADVPDVAHMAAVVEFEPVAETTNILAFTPFVEAVAQVDVAPATEAAPFAEAEAVAPVVIAEPVAPVAPFVEAAPVVSIASIAAADVPVSEPMAEVEPPAFAIAHVDTPAESAVSVHSESEADMSTQTPDFNPFATPSAPVDVPVSTRQSAYVPFPSLVDQPQPAVVLPIGRTSRESGMSESSGVALEKLVRLAASRGASALFLASGSRPSVRLDGDVQTLDTTAVLSAGDIEALLFGAAPDQAIDAVRAGAGEWVWELNDVGSVRCTTFRDSRGPGAVFRIVAVRPQSASQLGLSREIQSLGSETEGLVLVSGPRASGKSTLISSFVDLINRTRRDYVITLESEVNVTHERHGAFISQREVRGGSDEALAMARAALREDPDVLVIDDLRSSGLMSLALDAAANGQLVIGGVPAPHASGAVERLIDMYQPEQRRQVQLSLAQNLRGVVSQVLLRKNGGGRIAAREVLLNTPIVASLLAEGRTTQLPMAIEGGRKSGMVPLNDAFVGFVQSGAVDVREAYRRAADRAGLLELLKRQGIDTSVVERLA